MYQLKGDIKLTKNFKLSEFVCQDGSGEVLLEMELPQRLQMLRDCVNCPVEIISGYRNTTHNYAVGGRENSQHLLGRAADIKIMNILRNGFNYESLISLCINLGFRGIMPHSTTLHLDVRDFSQSGMPRNGLYAWEDCR